MVMENLMDQQLITATIVDMKWERITVQLDVKLDMRADIQLDDLDFYLVNNAYKARGFFKIEKLEDNVVRLRINVTNPGNCQCLMMGTYSIYVCDQEKVYTKCIVDPKVVPFMEDCSRTFLHNNRKKGYIVNFSVSETEEELVLVMYVMDAEKIPMQLKSNRQIVKEAIKEPICTLKRNMGHMYWNSVYHHYVKKYKKYKHTVLFMTEQSPTLGSNLVAVKNRMKERGMDNEYTILESARPASYEKMTKKSTRELIKKLARSKYVFIDDHAPILDWLVLNERTKLSQLWHAGAGFKSSGYSRWGHLGCPAPVSCHRQYSYGIAGSRHIGKFFAEVFGINDEQILPTGMPRMDEYLDENYQNTKREELYNTYPMCKGKKVILFAPTYRGRKRADASYPYHMIDFERLYDFCGDEYVVMFKMHPWVDEPVPIKEHMKDRFVDVNLYPNINDLFYIVEMLITDYSSNIFEFSLMRKPMLFFAFDKIQYSFSRGFHRDYEEAAPGKVCYTFDEVMDALEKKDYEYEKVEEYVEKHFDYIDSNASDRVIDWILLGNIPEDIKESIKATRKKVKKMKNMDFSSLKEEE
jgi:CDP-ribitol ribitolphosphotransferase